MAKGTPDLRGFSFCLMQETQKTPPGEGSPGLPQRPYLKPWYRVAKVDGRLVLEYAQSAVVLEGKAVEKLLLPLLPLLDGTRTLEEINAEVGEAAAPAVTNALTMLAGRGVLTDGPPLPDDAPTPVVETAHFLSANSGEHSVGESKELLDRSAITVLGAGATALEIAELFDAAGVSALTAIDWSQTASAPDADLIVVAPEPRDLPRLVDWNRLALDRDLPWLQALPFDGHMAAIGPLYVPGETCCYECYRRRRAANVSYPSDDYWALEGNPATYPSSPPLRHVVAGLAAALALQWLSDRAGSDTTSPVTATMHALAWGQTFELTSHRVHRVPRCPVCFPDDLGTPAPWHG